MKLQPLLIILVMMVIINTSSAKRKDLPASKSASKTPLTTVTVNAAWTWANPVFQHYNGYGSYYYDVFKVVVSASADYKFTSIGSVGTYGYLYLPSFNSTLPGRNIVQYGYPSGTNQQFEFTYNLESGISYYLVVTTSEVFAIGEYQLMVTSVGKATMTRITKLEPSMPNITFQSTLSNALPQLEDSCRSSQFSSYEIYSVVPTGNGTYIFEIFAEYGIEIRVHNPSFNPLETMLNIVGINSSTAYRSRQQLQVKLLPSIQYYLILSDYHYSYVQNYRLTARGPSQFNLTKITNNFVSTVKTSSSLTNTSRYYPRGSSGNSVYYYKVFRITVRQLAIYSLLGYSGISLTSYLYENEFSPLLFYQNWIASQYYSDTQAKFVTKAKLMLNKEYYLVVTTGYENEVGNFNFTVVGPQPVNISAVPDSLKSNVTLSSSLTSKSRKFRRCQHYYDNFYYNLFNITVPSVGLYTIRSQGSLNTFGCLYINQFEPTASDSFLISYDDGAGGNDQFAITAILRSNTVYYLAATTGNENVIGSFKLTVSGPAKATVSVVPGA